MNLSRLTELHTLKEIPRAGWVHRGIANPESVAGHSWGVAWLCLVLCPRGLDRHRVLAIAIVHDLIEVRTGDITPHDSIDRSTKHEMEQNAASDLFSECRELADLWSEYASHSTPESSFVHQVDKLDMALQALRYFRTTGVDTAEFVESASKAITHPSLECLVSEIRDALTSG